MMDFRPEISDELKEISFPIDPIIIEYMNILELDNI